MGFIGVQPASAPLTASDITDGVVSTAKLGDDAVSLAKMASGTDGQIITYDASGNPSAVGPGTDGQVLTSTGAGSPPAFEDAGGGASTLISTANVSDGTSTVNVSFTGSYELYYVIFNKVSPNTNDNTFRHAFSDDDFTSANQQLYGAFYRQEARRDGSTSNSTNHQAATGYVRIADNVGEDEYEGLSGIIYYASMKTAAPKARATSRAGRAGQINRKLGALRGGALGAGARAAGKIPRVKAARKKATGGIGAAIARGVRTAPKLRSKIGGGPRRKPTPSERKMK